MQANSTAARRFVSAGSTPRVLRRGEVLFFEGDSADHYYRLISGSIRTSRRLGDGRRQIDAFHLPKDTFGLETGSVHRFTAEALSAASVMALPAAHLAHDPALAAEVLKSRLRSLERAQDHFLLLGRRTARARLAGFLLDMAERIGRGDSTFELPMQRSDIADHLGLTIETVSRTLTQFVRNGIIRIVNGRWIAVCKPAELRLVEA